MKTIMKCFFLFLLNNLGILKFLHFKNRKKICVLMLHGVMAPHNQTTWIPLRPQLSPTELERILRILSDFYQFITVDQASDMLSGKIPLVDNAMLITFDDGYRNNLDFALPICKKFNIKPILFVVTDHVDSQLPFWFDRLDYALQQNMGELITFSFKGKKYSFDATSRKALIQSFKEFRDNCKAEFTNDIKMGQLFTALSEFLEVRSGMALKDLSEHDDWTGIVSWKLLNEAVKAGELDIGSHTVNHWRLDSLSEETLESQLTQSKICIETELSVKCHYFCYPNGNYNVTATSLVKKSGYKAAFSTDVGLCKSKDDLMTLKRFNFPSHKTKAALMYLLNS